MIAPLSVEVGRPVRFEGYAEDYGVPIVTVQFSLDDGENWTDYDVSASTGDRWVHWAFEYTPEVPGTYCLLVRSSGPLSMTTHEVIVVDLLQAATSLSASPCRGRLCWYTVPRIKGLRVFPGKS